MLKNEDGFDWIVVGDEFAAVVWLLYDLIEDAVVETGIVEVVDEPCLFFLAPGVECE